MTRRRYQHLIETIRSLLLIGLLSVTPSRADDLPPDASHLPDVDEEGKPPPSRPETYILPSWGNDSPKLVPRLWPGNSNSGSDPATTFLAELQLPPEVDPTQIPDLFLADYFGTIPETYLVDPQTLLTAHERTSINNALEQHSNNCGYPVYILLFQKTQMIPDFQNLEALHARWLGRKKGALIGFWLGSPTRTTIHFGAALREDYGERVDSSFAEALGQSYQQSYPFSQLDYFTYTLLWQLAHIDEEPATEPEPAKDIARLLAQPDFSDEPHTSWIPLAAGSSALALGVAALGVGVIAALRKREREQKEIPPLVLGSDPNAERLSAPYSGGSGAAVQVREPTTKIPS